MLSVLKTNTEFCSQILHNKLGGLNGHYCIFSEETWLQSVLTEPLFAVEVEAGLPA